MKTTQKIENKTLFEHAQEQNLIQPFQEIAKIESMAHNTLMAKIANGEIIIMTRKDKPPLGIGTGLRTKINANIGTSSDCVHPEEEIDKAKVAEKFGADTISDLSMGGNINKIRDDILNAISLPLTTVPIYQAVAEILAYVYRLKRKE